MEELRDKNGLTEKEFLASYDASMYPHPSLTADVALVAREGEKNEILLIRRGGHPYLGRFALPGGFSEPAETIEETAARELLEETGVPELPMMPLGFYTTPGRDPRGWVVTRVFGAVADKSELRVEAGDDAAAALWFDIKNEKCGEREKLTLTSGNTVITVEYFVKEVPSPLGKREVYEIINGADLAFDHGSEVVDSLKALGVI